MKFVKEGISSVQVPLRYCSFKFTGVIPVDAIEKRFSLSSGPGGQNVQKNATKAEIRFKIHESTWIPHELKEPLTKHFLNRINQNGEVIVNSERTRERNMNLADCFDKVRSAIYEVQRLQTLHTSTEEDVNIMKTKAERAAQQRLSEKRRLSEKKYLRSNLDI